MLQILTRFSKVNPKPLFWRLAVVNIAGLGLLFMAWMHDAIQHIYNTDSSRISLIIAGVFVIGVFLVLRSAWRGLISPHAVFLANMLVLFGLIGTVLGFIKAMSGFASGPIDATAVPVVLAQLTNGMGIALNASLVGLILSAWLLFNNWLGRSWSR